MTYGVLLTYGGTVGGRISGSYLRGFDQPAERWAAGRPHVGCESVNLENL